MTPRLPRSTEDGEARAHAVVGRRRRDSRQKRDANNSHCEAKQRDHLTATTYRQFHTPRDSDVESNRQPFIDPTTARADDHSIDFPEAAPAVHPQVTQREAP